MTLCGDSLPSCLPLSVFFHLKGKEEVRGQLWRRYINPDIPVMNKDLFHLTCKTLKQFGIDSPFKINILCVLSAI